MLQAINCTYHINNKPLVNGVSYNFIPGKFYGICGANGAGKTTFLKLLALSLPCSEGEIFYNHQKATPSVLKTMAKQRAVLSQFNEIQFPITVYEIVMMGRYPYFNLQPSTTDKNIVSQLMEETEITHLQNRNYLTLSGGEKQRVQFARAMAQLMSDNQNETKFLLLDEPISFLDLKYQFFFLNKIKELSKKQTVVIAVLHDLNLILNYADEVLLLKNGKLFSSGTAQQVLTSYNTQQAFEIATNFYTQNGINFIWPN